MRFGAVLGSNEHQPADRPDLKNGTPPGQIPRRWDVQGLRRGVVSGGRRGFGSLAWACVSWFARCRWAYNRALYQIQPRLLWNSGWAAPPSRWSREPGAQRYI